MTFVGALRHDGIIAPWVIDGPINGESFRTYVEQVLVPELRPGDIVVMDNLGSHKTPAIRQAIRAAGAKLFYLPAYSPDLNPIEQVVAKLKHLLRKALVFDQIVNVDLFHVGDNKLGRRAILEQSAARKRESKRTKQRREQRSEQQKPTPC